VNIENILGSCGYGESNSLAKTTVSTQVSGARDCMVDLETTDNKVTSTIASIGACMFNKSGIGEKFYVVVDVQSCKDVGMTESQSTLDWWAKQGEEARKIFAPETPKLSIHEALESYSAWFLRVKAKEMWGNGADFDNAILSHAYHRCGMKQPWGYGDSRCFRTIKNGEYMQVRKGVYHNALDDAITQAQWMIDKGLCPR